MKNPGILALLLLCCCSVAFTGGFFMGRNWNHTDIQVDFSAAETISPVPSSSGTIQERININTATLALLQTLPGIGPVLAQRILDYRQEHGPFSSLHELTNVSGIGEKVLEGILDYATTGG